MAHIGYGYGSEWHLLQYLGRRRKALSAEVEAAVGCGALEWLDHEDYTDGKTGFRYTRELRGLDFLSKESPVRLQWERMWPQSGNVMNWDAVAKSTTGTNPTWVLVEAKAHIGELASACGASEAGLQQIKEVFERTRAELGVRPDCDWLTGFYQYMNRITLLQFLRQRGVDAHLLFVYFTGDRTDVGGSGRECPASEAGWRPALEEQDHRSGIPQTSPIRSFIHRLFLPAYRAQIRIERSASGLSGMER
jgi:hypothetical protein